MHGLCMSFFCRFFKPFVGIDKINLGTDTIHIAESYVVHSFSISLLCRFKIPI